MLYVASPFLNEVGRHGVDVESEEVFYLCGEDGDGNTAREAHDNGVGDVFDDGAELEQSEEYEEHACHDGGDGESFDAVLLYDAVDDDDEGSRGASYLHLATAEQRDEEASHDGCDDAFLWRNAGGDAEGDGKRQRHDAYDDASHEVGHKSFLVVRPQRGN